MENFEFLCGGAATILLAVDAVIKAVWLTYESKKRIERQKELKQLRQEVDQLYKKIKSS